VFQKQNKQKTEYLFAIMVVGQKRTMPDAHQCWWPNIQNYRCIKNRPNLVSTVTSIQYCHFTIPVHNQGRITHCGQCACEQEAPPRRHNLEAAPH